MIQLTTLQSFISELLNMLEIIAVYRLLVDSSIVKNFVYDLTASLIIISIPITTLDSLNILFLIIYLWLNDKIHRSLAIIANNIFAISTGIIMLSLFDVVDHSTYLLFLKGHSNLFLLGWLIPVNDFLLTIIIGLIVTLFFQERVKWFKSAFANPIRIWRITLLLLFLYVALTAIAEKDGVVNSYASLMFIMYFIIIIIGGTGLINFTKNYQQAQQQQALIKGYQSQIKYSQRINKQFDNFRRERHDIKNLLLGVQGYIKDGENDKAEKMLSTFLDTNISDKHYLDVDNALSKLQISGLRNLIKEKAYQIVEQRILLAIEINNEISSLPGSEVKTARIIGILLDNAIEATKNQKKPYVQIALLQHDENLYELIVANSLGAPVDINKAMKFEHSTKQGHQGIGLSNVMKLVDHDQHYSFSAEVKDKVIIMTCFIQGKSE